MAQSQGGCKKKLRKWTPVQKMIAQARSERRKDANVRRSSHGVFSNKADLIAGKRTRPNKNGIL